MTNWPFLIPLALLVAAIPVFQVVRIGYFKVKWNRKVNRDFTNARGTLHRNILQNALANLNREVSTINERLAQLTQQRTELQRTRDLELEKILTPQIVSTELTDVPGIGSVLKDRLIKECFNGTLESLNRASSVHGIGHDKGKAVEKWVRQTRRKMPQLLQRDFSGKAPIMKKYADLDENLLREINARHEKLQELQALIGKATTVLNDLKTVSKATFSKAYSGDEQAAETVTHYLNGIFPEWERIPIWYKTLVEKYGKV